MNYIQELRKFINSQYLYSGMRITAGIIIPAIILYHYGLLSSYMAIPLGAMCVSMTDSVGPPHHRRNILLASIGIYFLVILLTGILRQHAILVVAGIVVFGIFFSLIGVYGQRISSIGSFALLVFIFGIDGHFGNQSIWMQAVWFSLGGLWYALLSMLLYTLQPYRLIQLSLGECVMHIASYLKIKASFYEKEPHYNELNNQLMQEQIQIRKLQDDLREMLFKMRHAARESTIKGRVLMKIFLDSIDLFERIMTSQQDYKKMHEKFDKWNILEEYRSFILLLAQQLQEIALSIQEERASKQIVDLDAAFKKTSEAFTELRKAHLTPNNIEDFIVLRQILYNLQDIAERIKLLHVSTYDKQIVKDFTPDVKLEQFVSHQQIEPKLLIENLSLKSSHFRHAIRLTGAMLVGYFISFFFPIGHSYWILLTITAILKPAYSITQKRNKQRLAGTLVGASIGFALLYATHNHTVIFITMLLFMILSYTFVRVNYFIGSAGITAYVMLSFYFLSPQNFTNLLTDRIIDTVIGSAIASAFAAFVFPVWAHEEIKQYMLEALKANKKYFQAAASMFLGKPIDITSFKVARKDAFIALANVSDNFQKMLSEPKNKQKQMAHYHQFVVTSQLLTSYIASLSYYAQRTGSKYASTDFSSLVEKINLQFQQAILLLEAGNNLPQMQSNNQNNLLQQKIQQLLEARKLEIERGEDTTEVRKTLSDLKTIVTQFELIYSLVQEQCKILKIIQDEEQVKELPALMPVVKGG